MTTKFQRALTLLILRVLRALRGKSAATVRSYEPSPAASASWRQVTRIRPCHLEPPATPSGLRARYCERAA